MCRYLALGSFYHSFLLLCDYQLVISENFSNGSKNFGKNKKVLLYKAEKMKKTGEEGKIKE